MHRKHHTEVPQGFTKKEQGLNQHRNRSKLKGLWMFHALGSMGEGGEEKEAINQTLPLQADTSNMQVPSFPHQATGSKHLRQPPGPHLGSQQEELTQMTSCTGMPLAKRDKHAW